MTVKEALISTVNFPLPENRIEKSLIDAGLSGQATYGQSDAQAVDMCMAGLLLTLITSPDVTEDDVSIKLPSREVLMKVRVSLIDKWAPVVVDSKPIVKQVRFW